MIPWLWGLVWARISDSSSSHFSFYVAKEMPHANQVLAMPVPIRKFLRARWKLSLMSPNGVPKSKIPLSGLESDGVVPRGASSVAGDEA